MWLLSMELFGTALTLPDFPRIKSIRGLGMTDWNEYALRLGDRFDYRNTYYNREPKFDITNPAPEDFGRYDFLISSEVFEHVLPPPERAFENAFRILKPAGVFILTVPYSLESMTLEHYPEIHEFGFAQVGGETVLVNRTRTGELQIFDRPVFHGPGSGKALELREYCEGDVKRMVGEAGFLSLRIATESQPQFGIAYREQWSLPMVARKGEFAFSVDAARAVIEEARDERDRANGERERMERSAWFRLGRALKFY
jgi:SAM-dependent methyltransferase